MATMDSIVASRLEAVIEESKTNPHACRDYILRLIDDMKKPGLPPVDIPSVISVEIAEEESNFDVLTRHLVLKRDRYHCVACGSGEDLQVHHIFPKRLGGTPIDINLVTLCRSCHTEWETNFRNHWKSCGIRIVYKNAV